MDTKRFFNVALPHMITKQWDVFRALKGSVSIQIKEQGSWTINLGNIQDPIESTGNDSDLNLWFLPEAFQGFINGDLDIISAAQEGAVKGQGDFRLLERLGSLFNPPTSALGIMLTR